MTSPLLTPEIIEQGAQAMADHRYFPGCWDEIPPRFSENERRYYREKVQAALIAALPSIVDAVAKVADSQVRWDKANAYGPDSLIAVRTGQEIAAAQRALAPKDANKKPAQP